MQTIGATFRAYKMEGLSDDIYDPLSNIVAAIRYMVNRYGSIEKVMSSRRTKWRGYATGTDNATPGLHWVGENGPELLQFKGGERVYTASESKKIAQATQVTKAKKENFTLAGKGGETTVNNDNSVNIEAGAVVVNQTFNGGDTKEIIEQIQNMPADITKEVLIALAQKLGNSGMTNSGAIA